MSTLTCADVRDLACELALDVLDGGERAAVLTHLETCAACRADVASLTRAADELLLLVPEVEPRPGFEDRVLARLDAAAAAPVVPPPRPARRRPRRLLLAAAAALVLLAMTATLALRDRSTGPVAAAPAARMITVRGQDVGNVTVGPGATTVRVAIPDWKGLVRSYGGTVDGSYWVLVRRAGGAEDRHLLPSDQRQPWTIAVGGGAGAVRSVSVVDAAGTVWCTAHLTA